MYVHSAFLAVGLAITLSDISSVRAQTDDKLIGILLAAGDISTKDSSSCPNNRANTVAGLIRKVIEDANVPVRVLALGDLAYEKGTEQDLKCFARRWSGFEDVLLPVPGNHEYQTTDAGSYFKHFKNNPFVHQNDKKENDTTDQRWDKKGYFSLPFPGLDGPWRLIGLNDNFHNDDKYKKDMEDQFQWLEKTLHDSDVAKEKCVLAFWHEPIFSSGRHGHRYKKPKNTPLTNRKPMQKAFRILHSHGASVVLTGHDHNYEQFRRHDANGNAAEDGIRSFVVGTGGSGLTQDHYIHLAPNSEGGPFGMTKGTQGVLKIDLYKSRYEWDFLPVNNAKKPSLQTTKASCTERKKPPL
jgi:hypothetical protein